MSWAIINCKKGAICHKWGQKCELCGRKVVDFRPALEDLRLKAAKAACKCTEQRLGDPFEFLLPGSKGERNPLEQHHKIADCEKCNFGRASHVCFNPRIKMQDALAGDCMSPTGDEKVDCWGLQTLVPEEYLQHLPKFVDALGEAPKEPLTFLSTFAKLEPGREERIRRFKCFNKLAGIIQRELGRQIYGGGSYSKDTDLTGRMSDIDVYVHFEEFSRNHVDRFISHFGELIKKVEKVLQAHSSEDFGVKVEGSLQRDHYLCIKIKVDGVKVDVLIKGPTLEPRDMLDYTSLKDRQKLQTSVVWYVQPCRRNLPPRHMKEAAKAGACSFSFFCLAEHSLRCRCQKEFQSTMFEGTPFNHIVRFVKYVIKQTSRNDWIGQRPKSYVLLFFPV